MKQFLLALLVLGFAINSVADEPAPVGHAAALAVEQLDVHPDLEVKLFASEPMMTNPASIDVDHLGRV